MPDQVTPTTPLDLDAIKARAAAATRGPWRYGPWRGNRGRTLAMVRTPHGCLFNDWSGINDDADGEFVAHARADVDALVAEVERLRDDEDKAKHQCACTCSGQAGHHVPLTPEQARLIIDAVGGDTPKGR